MKPVSSLCTALVAALLLAPLPTLAQTPAEKAVLAEENKRLGSLYLRCDGQPNNITGAESFARLLGALTLLSLFAPTPESPDASKRLFGEKGVEACSKLLDDPKEETNGLRRLPLILGRAVHQIEAKNFPAAITDVQKAPGEATALNLVGNAYFDQSLGLSFDLIEAEARLRGGDAVGAREVGLRQQALRPYSFYAAVSARPFSLWIREVSPAEEAYWRSAQKILPGLMFAHAARLEEAGRFAEAAELRESSVTLFQAFSADEQNSRSLATAAIAHALAGNSVKAKQRADQAQSNMDSLTAAGKAENDVASVVELLDFYRIIDMAGSGKIDEARRNFAARSAWLAPGIGPVMAANARLRQGARADQLFGALARTPDQLWEERRVQFLAQRVESDKNNRTLFTYILPYATISGYESLSKSVWRTDKHQLVSREPMKDSKFHSAHVYGDPMTQQDALLLSAAVQAKAKGYPGFVYLAFPGDPTRAMVQFGRPEDPDIAKPLFLDADAVIAELRQLIPSPAELEARKKARK